MRRRRIQSRRPTASLGGAGSCERRAAHRRARPSVRRRGGAGAPGRPSASAPHGADRPATLTVVRSRWHQSRLLVALRRRRRPQRRRGAARAVPGHRRRPGRAPEDPEEFYDHQLVGLGRVDHRRARRWASSPRYPRHRPGPPRGPHPRRPRGAGPVRDRAGPGRRRAPADGSRSPTVPGLLTPLPESTEA